MALSPIDIVITTAAWAVVVYKAPALAHRDRRVWATWIFMLGFAVSLTLKLPPVSLALNGWVGVNNLSWLLCYGAVILALFANAYGCCALRDRPVPKWLLPGLGAVLAVLGWLFAAHIAPSPEYPDRALPRSIYDAVFMNLTYLYCALCLALIHRTFAHLVCIEQNAVTRCRWRLIWLAALAGAGFCWARISFVLLVYSVPNLPGVMHIARLGDGLLAFSCLMWPLFGLSHQVYALLAPPLRYIDNLLALRDLLIIRARLHRWLPTVIKPVPTWRHCLTDPEFYLYETVIAIFDGQKTLSDCFKGVSLWGTMTHPDNPWDVQAWQGAWALLQALKTALAQVPDERDYLALVTAWREVGRALRR